MVQLVLCTVVRHEHVQECMPRNIQAAAYTPPSLHCTLLLVTPPPVLFPRAAVCATLLSLTQLPHHSTTVARHGTHYPPACDQNSQPNQPTSTRPSQSL